MAIWEADYKGHRIRVENSVLGEKLFIDNQLASKDSHLFRSELRAVISAGDGQGEEVVAMLHAGLMGVGCRVVVNQVELFRHSVWSLRPMWS